MFASCFVFTIGSSIWRRSPRMGGPHYIRFEAPSNCGKPIGSVWDEGRGGLLREPAPKSKSDFALRKSLANDVLSKHLTVGWEEKFTHHSNACFAAKAEADVLMLLCSTPASNALN